MVDFALCELVRNHRDSFPPLWSRDSWAKLLIWLALNCGCSGDEAGLEAFAAALGPYLSQRLRRTFFSRELADLNLQVLADPAEERVLLQPLQVEGQDDLAQARVVAALARVALLDRVVQDHQRWQRLEALIAIPWEVGAACG